MNTKGPKMPVLEDANVVKIAVEMTDQTAQLISFNQKQPLATIIHDLCNVWGLTDFDQYALQFSENTNKKFITEKTRSDVKNGSVIKLTFSPSKTANDILLKLTGVSVDDKVTALEQLYSLSTDITFALEFINKQGLALLISMVVEGNKAKKPMLAYTLLSFVDLMEHGIVSWDILEPAFINKIASFVNNQSESEDARVIQAALSILESIVLDSTVKYPLVEKEVTVSNIVMHLQNQCTVTQQNAIALINALFIKAEVEKKKAIAASITSKQVRNVILTNIIQSPTQVGTEMAHQLYVLQTLILGLLETRMNTKMDLDQDAREKILELRRIAFDSDGSGAAGDSTARKQLGGFTKDYKKLGFKSDINPALDFTETPPGILALDSMIYFARNHVESYTKVVLENSCRADEHECPFGRTSVELVKLLCDILRIGESPSEQGVNYHTMFFTHDHFFDELYSICIVLLNKTWKEMRASTEDFVKVLSVVREQITRALGSHPIGMEQFRAKLVSLTYSEITNLWQQDRTKREEQESHARPIVELKEMITPEILSLIQNQRLHFLCEGTRFTKYSSRGHREKDKFWFVRLSPNHKVLYYGDCDEKSAPAVEDLPNKLSVIDIKTLVTGKDCPHMKDIKGRKTTHALAFSLLLESVEMASLDFVAPDEQMLDYWTDGINALLGNKMVSKETKNDIDTLLSMEIKLRLLDAEGVVIPENPPVVPPPPDNYHFCFQFN